mmetsp:Transcript_42016/g.101246  ORF Transcript_42016/g.101246 Transcript_42016/m.101246 type:complete len:204 (-) Transcript_42016:185-796(-)
MQTFEEWAMNTVFGTYAWNASPVDGTNVQRAFGATGQHFKFPLDNTAISLSDARSKNRISRGSSGQATMEHIDTMFPLFFTQGDIVMVQKQVQSNASEGIPAKLVLKAKGPYRVIEKASEDSYYLQKIPGTSTMLRTKGSKPTKESAFRMHKIPSTIVIHKRVDTPDTRLASMRQMLSHSPQFKNYGTKKPNQQQTHQTKRKT